MFIALRVYFRLISTFKKFQNMKFKDLIGIFVMFGGIFEGLFYSIWMKLSRFNWFWVCVLSVLRQGGLLVNFHPSILTCLLPQLTSPRLAVRKRTIIALGHLVMSCGNMVFVDLIEHLLTELSKNDSMSTTRTYIQCIAAISRQAGHRIGKKNI